MNKPHSIKIALFICLNRAIKICKNNYVIYAEKEYN
jgi:hypothetical protein